MFLDHQLIIERILDQVQGLEVVAEAASLDAVAQGGTIPSPGCWVVPLIDQVAVVGAARTLTDRFGVIIVARAITDPKGGAATVELREWRDAIYTALNKWRPETCWTPILYQRGSLRAIQTSAYWWMDEYQTQLGLQ